MGPSAHVTETSALIDFRATLCTFADQAQDALAIIEHDIRRAQSFLDEKAREWQSAIRRSEEEVIQAKIEFNQRRNQRIGDRKPDTTFQEKVLRRAQAKLEFAEEKLAAVKRWQRDLPHELMNYEGPALQLRNALDGTLPKMIAFMDRKIVALEQYLNKGVS
jgi:hypothetical protein